MTTINQFFDRVVYLNMTERTDRNKQMQDELKRWIVKAERFEALPGETAAISFNKSMCAILHDFLTGKGQFLLVLEDDVTFTTAGMAALKNVFNDIASRRWSQLYLGGNLWHFPFEMVTKNLARVEGLWTTHACGYTREGAQVIYNAFKSLTESPVVYDDWLAHTIHPTLTPPAYLMFPMAAIQRNSYSNLMGDVVNYNVCWKNTDERLKVAAKRFR